ncbi:Cell division trigger factor [Lysobacter dokdonensis DS-58]|uniref:Trigger factor n=1 Tax=Lysobacter dokdonensis DS-58 TaxID=1300345 RepID=A0A0A2WIX1_9GAMM|nr:trigger factor [Lysobacter dokdonensis]KGQ19748.1 Cell division trigger factor [Lysobacter dokdonensis DS-58]
MQVSVETLGNLERRLTFRLPAERVDTQVGGRLKEIARTARIKGFRPGKVPTKVIEQRYGDQVRQEILDGMLRESFDGAIRENELRLAGNPRIEPSSDAAGEGELAFVATFEIVPDFGDVDVEGLEVVRHTAEVEDADIDRMIDNLRMQRQGWNKVERAAKEHDLVTMENFSEVDGVRRPPEGAEKGSTVVGSGAMLKEIEDAVIGMAPGETKTVQVDFPAEWRIAEFAGKTVSITVKALEVSEPQLPEVDAGFIRSFGVKSGEMDQFRAEIRSNLARELKGALMQRLRKEVGEQLVAKFEHVEMPPRLVENEARALANGMAEQARRQGQQVAVDQSQFMEPARKRVLVALLVGEIARRNELRLDQRRLNETMRLIASTYEEPEQVIELYRNDPQLMAGLQSRVMEEQVIDWIAERAKHTEQALSFQDAIRQ